MTSMTSRAVSVRIGRLATILAVFTGSQRVAAFTLDSPISEGCHEMITGAAVRAAGWPADAPALEPDAAHAQLLASMPFAPATDLRDPRSLSLLLGVRDPDLRGRTLTDFNGLVGVHGADEAQRFHCLRAHDDDGPDGDVRAIEACRRVILDEIGVALGQGDVIDGTAREAVDVPVVLRGHASVLVPRFAFHIGRAIHTLQDSFTHALRSSDGHRVRSVMNWVDYVSEHDYEVSRDGLRHDSALDHCTGGDPDVLRRAALATEASTALLEAVRLAEGGRAGRLARAAAVLDVWLTVEGGCTFDNRFCDLPGVPSQLQEAGCAVQRAGRTGRDGVGGVLAIVGLALAVSLARRSGIRCVGAGAVLMLVLLAPRVARADGTTESSSVPVAGGAVRMAEGTGSGSGGTTVSAPRIERFRPFAIDASLGVSLVSPALAVGLGARWYAHPRFSLGVHAEYNPWFSLDGLRASEGAANFYATATWAYVRLPGVEVRARMMAGTSVLLSNVVGTEPGDVGAFVGLSLLGISIPVGHSLCLNLDGDTVAAVPHLTGVPFVYGQYRLTFSVTGRL